MLTWHIVCAANGNIAATSSVATAAMPHSNSPAGRVALPQMPAHYLRSAKLAPTRLAGLSHRYSIRMSASAQLRGCKQAATFSRPAVRGPAVAASLQLHGRRSAEGSLGARQPLPAGTRHGMSHGLPASVSQRARLGMFSVKASRALRCLRI